jgi:hypothetical protein
LIFFVIGFVGEQYNKEKAICSGSIFLTAKD